MDYSPWNLESRLSFERASMRFSTTSPSSHSTSLPPLHQAIPEFHSHNPHERRASSVPRKLVERESPPFTTPHRVSPDPILENQTRKIENVPRELHKGSYDAQTYKFPGCTDSRRPNTSLTHSQSRSVDIRTSSYLPPVSSMASSRDSSFESERPPIGSSTLPLLYNSHQPSHGSYGSQYDNEIVRTQQNTPDYHRYSTGNTASSSVYRPSSPMSNYSQSQYPSSSGSYSQHPPYSGGYPSRCGPSHLERSPYLGGVSNGDVGVDHFEGRPGKRRRGNLPKQTTDLLRSWLHEHIHHPYPTEEEKQMLMNQTGLTIHQISNWFINARRRRLPGITTDSKSSGTRRPSSVQ